MTAQRVLGPIWSIVAGLAATLLASALAVPILWAAVSAVAGQPWFGAVAPFLLVTASAVAAYIAVVVIDGVAGRTRTRVVVATLALLAVLRVVSTVSAGGTGRDAVWQCAAAVVAAAVMAWRFRATDLRRRA